MTKSRFQKSQSSCSRRSWLDWKMCVIRTHSCRPQRDSSLTSTQEVCSEFRSWSSAVRIGCESYMVLMVRVYCVAGCGHSRCFVECWSGWHPSWKHSPRLWAAKWPIFSSLGLLHCPEVLEPPGITCLVLTFPLWLRNGRQPDRDLVFLRSHLAVTSAFLSPSLNFGLC